MSLTVSEVINRLELLKEKFGDLEVTVRDESEGAFEGACPVIDTTVGDNAVCIII